ncbi:MAG: type I pullulanase [Ruminococcus sp.]|nr:type I pullulanase [Ruminococcus sp.]
MRIKRMISVILTAMMATSAVTVGTITSSAASNPTEYENAAHEIDQQYRYDGTDLGATYTPASTTFKVWAPTGTKCVLKFYKAGNGGTAYETHEMTKDEEKGIFSVTVSGDLKNVYYTYDITAASIIGGEAVTTETPDVYSVATGVNGKRSMVCDLDSTDPEGWDKDTHVITDDVSDASVWEIHVKDFSYNENSGVSEKNRGKYLAFTETGTTLDGKGDVSTGIDYLKELGVTYVQLNPVYDYGSVDESGADNQFNWGYDPMNYNVPEGSYSSDPYNGNTRINELKQMIQALHKAGIGVIMDVVYNHTYNTNTAFQACVPDYYYRKTSKGAWSSGSGCGNDTASERAMFRNFMIQSTKYWAEEYHIDGFRFDLMGLHDVNTMNKVRESLDQIDEGIIMYGEGWAMSTTYDVTDCDGNRTVLAAQNATSVLNKRVGMFNDQFRDSMKGSFSSITATGFIQGTSNVGNSKGVKYGVRANSVGKGSSWRAQSPSQCVNYISCHDNNTLYDKLVASVAKTTDYRARNNEVVNINKFAETIAATSQGVHLMLAGEEMARSKDGDENSYSSPATENMLDWNNVVEFQDLVSYYKGMMDIRKAFSPFTTDDVNVSTNQYNFTDAIATDSATFGYVVSNTQSDEWNKLAVVLNSQSSSAVVNLTDADENLSKDTEWVVIADGEDAGLTAIKTVKGNSITVPALTAMVLVEKTTFDSVNLAAKSNKSKVNVVYKDTETNKILSKRVLYGSVGTNYVTSPDQTLSDEYVLEGIDGDTKGTFTTTDKTVTYNYRSYVPECLTKSVSGNEKVSVKDATLIQKYLVDDTKLTEEQVKLADYNMDGKVDVNDATTVQKFVNKDNYGAVNTITVKYINKANYKEIATAKKYKAVAGKSDSYQPISVIGYKYVSYEVGSNKGTDENVTVNYDFKNKILCFYYTEDKYDVTLHVKHSGSETWQPTLWAWYAVDGTDHNIYDGWPGQNMTKGDDDWYDATFKVPNGAEYSLIISENQANQTQDYKGYTAPEMWITIDDSAISKGGDYLIFSTEKP